MEHSTEQRATAQQADLDQLIAEAASATGILPTIDRCEQLRDRLRPHIRRLSEQVRQRQDHLPRDDADWIRCERALLQAQGALTGSLGSGLRSAALHVHTLGEAAAVLADCIRDD
ncbi:DUF6415 family natural product biosynthesis protein [Streptomyces sp. 351MFTsu5.1]|uniref:DUF6415 family natural product biosynthesis protein n=1 Tax=Streptomyces sp. 351MFTsu5.1 TaxID=1172180 RepID=UPI0003711E7F|nr:DUF6415 family natural product biosynthesis protein [Streptomyces sp. 351MFTsu5.1]